MTVTWRSAVSYALTVTIGSWMTGAAVDLAWSAAADSLGTWLSVWVANVLSYVFLTVTTLTLTLTRRCTAPMPAWRIPLIDGGVYLLVLLLWSGLSAWRDGAAVPVDDAFATAGFALLTLQLPSAWLLSVWRARHLRVVLQQIGSGGTKAAGRANSDWRRAGCQAGGHSNGSISAVSSERLIWPIRAAAILPCRSTTRV